MTSGKEKSKTLSILRKGYDKGIIGYNKGIGSMIMSVISSYTMYNLIILPALLWRFQDTL